MTTWLPGARVHNLTPGIGNGPFRALFGVVLHVNVDEYGTPASFWGNGNPGQVCPNFQIFKDGSVDQMLPFNWQPWCQIDGNFNYAAIETAGLPSEPLTDAQVASIARILRIYHDEHGVPLTVANAPGQRGFGIHQMGGAAWGGHACPGTLRANQRPRILAAASAHGTDVSSYTQLDGNPLMADKLTPAVLAQISDIIDARVRAQLNLFTVVDSDAKGEHPGHQIRTIVQTELDPALAALEARLNAHVDAQTSKLAHSAAFGLEGIKADVAAVNPTPGAPA